MLQLQKNHEELFIVVVTIAALVSIIVLAQILDDRPTVAVYAAWMPALPDGQDYDPGTEGRDGVPSGVVLWVEVDGVPETREWFLENRATLKQVDLVWVDPNKDPPL